MFAEGWRGAALVGLVLAGCGSSPTVKPRTAAYLRVVEARVAAASESTRFVLRHNPAACGCPPFEVQLGDTWQRAELVGVEPDDTTILGLEAKLEAHPDAEMTIEGRLDGELATCGRGMLYVSIVPSALVDPASSD